MSAKTNQHVDKERGIDGNKKMKPITFLLNSICKFTQILLQKYSIYYKGAIFLSIIP